ncbi:MAG: hypothetical protein JW953_17335 [Anaerolineae bacterium]|nr:hypothetical protein [Anaerolineae bacterium]
MKVSQIAGYQSPYLKNSDLPSPAQAVVMGVTLETLFNPSSNKREERLLLTFKGKRKKLILNKTQAARMVEMFGDETGDWVGQVVRLVPITDRGKPSIKVERPPANGQPPVEPEPEPIMEDAGDDEFPF